MSIGHRNRSDLLISTALQTTVVVVLSLPAAAQPAPNARPTGGSVVGGAAAISQTGSNTRIEQSSQRAAIDWKSFNVGSQQSVTFSQPSANAVALNRVTGPDPSQIAGRIDANGQIILVNQSGVNFYKGAQVNAAGVMVSAAGISNQNFMAGVMKFDQPGDPNARIDNQGSITVKQAGLAALVAPRVANSGTITARLGHVVLAGAKTATLDLYGDGLLSLDVSDQVTQAPVGKDGRTATALVTNSGLVVADGGTVQLTARAADGIVQNLVQAGGQIRAATMGDHTGTIALNGVGGSIVVDGPTIRAWEGARHQGRQHRSGVERQCGDRLDGKDRSVGQDRRRCHRDRHHIGSCEGWAGRHGGDDGDERYRAAGRDDRGQCRDKWTWRTCRHTLARHHTGGRHDPRKRR